MSNNFYNHSTFPAPNGPGSSAALRSELDLIAAGFDKLPTLSGNANKLVVVNSAGTALVASTTLQGMAITGGTLDNTPIGATTRAAGNFTNLSVNGSAGLGNAVTIGGGTINNTPIGGTTASSGAFTTVSASSGFTGNLTGNVTGSVTGNVAGNLSGNVTAGSGTSTFNNVTINGTLDMNSGTVGTITGLATPTNDSDAATKGYVDSVAQGLDVKPSVRVATTANITLSGAQTIDGVSVIAGDRVLVKDQSSATENGVYVAASGGWSRSTDMDAWAELPGAFVFVEQGTANDNSGWVCTVSAGGSLGSTSVTFEQFSGAGQITAGAGMTKTGNTLNVGTASSSRIVVNADNVDLAATGVTANTYKSVTVDIYGRVTAGTNPTTLTGYGISDAYTKTEIDSIFGSTTAAATSAANAATSATNASNSATAAGTSATNASTSATNAAASYDSFDDRYLGPKTSNPSTDNDGNALLTGAIYWNSTASEMRVWNGSAWISTYLPAGSYLLKTGDTMTGDLTIANGTDSRVNLQVSGVTEGILTASSTNVRLSSANAIPITIGTNGVTRLTFTGTGFITTGASEYVGIGQQAGTNNALRVARNLENGTSAYGVVSDGTFQSGVTVAGAQFRSVLRTQAASFTLADAVHYNATQATLGAGSAVTTQTGFLADSTITGATNNYGFRGQIAAGTNRWNLYMDGTAANYLGGTTTFARATQEARVALGAGTAIDLSLGNYFTKTISGTTTLTVSNTPATGTAASFILDLTNGGSSTINWWSGVKWAGGTAPTLTSSGRDVLGFFTHDGGTTWSGLVLGKDVK
jgi:hypothetical protein